MKTDPDLSIKLKLNSRPNEGVFVPTIPRAPEPKVGDILWGRIIVALLLVLALGAGLIWGGWRLLASPAQEEAVLENAVPAVDMDRTSIEDKPPIDVAPVDDQAEQAPVVDAPPSVAATTIPATAMAKPQMPDASTAENAAAITASKPVTTPKAAEVAANLETSSPEVSIAAEKTAVKVLVPAIAAASTHDAKNKMPAASHGSLASITLHSKNITQAALSLGIDQREPKDALPALVRMGDKALLAVYFFTSYANLKGQTLYHDWYRNGERVARVKSRPSSAHVEVYSSKFIDQYLLGDWQVKVVNSAGKVLAEGRFEVES